jgi:predicted protein tyrosine phosphatase
MLQLADRIIVFEKRHRNRIRTFAPDLYATLTIECLYIPDEFEFKNRALIGVLVRALSPLLGPPSRITSDEESAGSH